MRFVSLPPHRCALTLLVGWCFSLLGSPALAVFTEQRASWFPGGFNVTGYSASLADIDNDGDLDVLFAGSSLSAQQLFRNNTINAGGTASKTFTNVTSTMWETPTYNTSTWSAAWADYNGDGLVDVFVGQNNNGFSRGRLMKNTGAGFVDVSTATGLNSYGFAQNVAWVDMNNDQLLDMVIGMENTEPNTIYLQNSAHQFTAVAPENGISNPVVGRSYGMAIGDADGDGDLDIYMSPCLGDGGNATPKAYYKNNLVESGPAKTLSFTDVSYQNGTQNISKGYGAEFVDFDNDGMLDLYATGSNSAPTKIYKNIGSGQFIDVDTITMGPLLSSPGTDLNGSKAIDYDNDGDLDLFFHDNLNGGSNAKLYRNDSIPNAANPADRWKFTDVTTAQAITNAGLGGYDSTWGDIDLDGDLDLINPNNSSTSERVYINDASTNGNHWLHVRLKGPGWNTRGVGSSLYATLNTGTPSEVTLRREANTNAGTFNQSDLPVHFGLGAASLVDQLLVRWADGTAQVLRNIAGDQYLSVTYFPGDYNGDNIVDTGDYIIWQKGFGGTFTMNDYLTWRSNFGKTLPPGAGTIAGAEVPEPTAIALVAISIVGCIVPRRRPFTRRSRPSIRHSRVGGNPVRIS